MSTVIFQMVDVCSSASLELLVGVIAEKLYDLHLDPLRSGQDRETNRKSLHRSQLWDHGPIYIPLHRYGADQRAITSIPTT